MINQKYTHNVLTNEVIVEPMSAEEIKAAKDYAEIHKEKRLAEQAEAEAKAQAKATAEGKLTALGLTTDDLRALGL
jgi:hypothetical protein